MKDLSRRKFLGLGTAAIAGAALTRTGKAFGASAPSFTGGLNRNLLVSPNELWSWQNMMVDLGTRFTGSPAHISYLTFLENQCQKAGLTTFHDPTQYFPKWSADYTQCKLSIVEEGGSFTDLDVMSYFPGSGSTLNMPSGALVAPIVDAGMGLPQDFAAGIATGSFKGSIAFCTEKAEPMTDALGYPNYYLNDPDMTMTPATPFNKWSLNILAHQSLATPQIAQQAGCSGIIIALESSTKNALGQYISFLAKVIDAQWNGAPGLPILYVDYQTGEYLKSRLSALGTTSTARMVLPATCTASSGTDEIIAVLPGATYGTKADEIVVVASHTDGTSASEENGPLGMLAIAKYFAQIPQSQRRRTMVFCFATGHFTGYTKDTAWFIQEHPEMLKKTVAAMAIEHLGQKSFTDDPKNNRYIDDGLPEVGISYVSQDPSIIATVSQNYAVENLTRAPVINGPGFGVGTPFFEQAIPTYAYITGPNSLYQMDPVTIMEATDKARLHQEVRTFIRILNSWESLDAATISAKNVVRSQIG